MKPWRLAVAEKLCTKCGRLNRPRANFCSDCGAQDFVEVSAEQLTGTSSSQGAVADAAVLLSVTRIVLLSAVTYGLYFFYWLYLTWKQLQGETREVHYPVWHALTLFVPIYGLFRLHKHMGIVQALALRAGVNTSLTPGLAVVLIALTWVLGFVSTGAKGIEIVVFNTVSFALTTTAMVWAQGTLNAYWYKVRETPLHYAPVGVGERVLIFLGILLWLNVILGVFWD
jgi:RNA polymerase subunit RPABC4/transcription elongation factor Spt4